jgi:hypothetical protein
VSPLPARHAPGPRDRPYTAPAHRLRQNPRMNMSVQNIWLPTDPPKPCPRLLTEEEAIIYLRLDKTKVKDPHRTFTKYRERGLIKGYRIGRCVRYRAEDLERFVDSKQC